MTKPRKRKVPNATTADEYDTGTLGKDKGDRVDNEEEGSVGTDVGEAEASKIKFVSLCRQTRVRRHAITNLEK